MVNHFQEIRGAGAIRGSAACRSPLPTSVLPGGLAHHDELNLHTPGFACKDEAENVLFPSMALIPIKTASETGYCDCICGCYELASLRDEDTGKGYCPACGKDHLDLNAGAGIPQPAPQKLSANSSSPNITPSMPTPATPPRPLPSTFSSPFPPPTIE